MNRIFLSFKNIDKIPKQIFDALINDEDLFRLLFYDSDSPLSELALTLKQKVNLIYDRPEKENSRVFFSCYADNVEDFKHSEIRISIPEVTPVEDNLAELMIRIDIICHNNLILVKGGNRDRLILQHIVKNLNGSGSANSVSQLQLPLGVRIVNLQFNDNFQGYRVHFRGRISDEGVEC